MTRHGHISGNRVRTNLRKRGFGANASISSNSEPVGIDGWGIFTCCACGGSTQALVAVTQQDLSAYENLAIKYGTSIDFSPCYVIRYVTGVFALQLTTFDVSKVITTAPTCAELDSDPCEPTQNPYFPPEILGFNGCANRIGDCCYSVDATATYRLAFGGGTVTDCNIEAFILEKTTDITCGVNPLTNYSFTTMGGAGTTYKFTIKQSGSNYYLDTVTLVNTLDPACLQYFLWQDPGYNTPVTVTCEGVLEIDIDLTTSPYVAINEPMYTDMQCSITINDTGEWLYNPVNDDCDYIGAP